MDFYASFASTKQCMQIFISVTESIITELKALCINSVYVPSFIVRKYTFITQLPDHLVSPSG